IVLMGAPTLGFSDVVATPFDAALPGIELHANVIDNALRDRYLFRDWSQKAVDLAIILAFGILTCLYLPKLNANRSVFYSVLMFSAFAAFNFWTFFRLQWILSFVYPGLSIVATSALSISYKYVTEDRHKKRTKEKFKHYLDTHVIDQAVNEPE